MIPASWMPAAKMARIHVHWTGGAYKANAVDLKSYHILIEGDGKLVKGTPSIKANEAPMKAGAAYHTLNANTGAIGVSMCCMGGAGVQEEPLKAGKWPLTAVQWDQMVKVVAELCRRYGIAVTPKTVLTHAEVQPTLGIKQRNKWDVTRLAFEPKTKGHKACGDKLRREVAAALAAMPSNVVPLPAKPIVKPEPAAEDRPAVAVALFRKLGWPRCSGIALVGNAQQEVYHDLRLGAKGDKHLPGGSIGMFQWNDGSKGQYTRRTDFLAWCKLHGLDPLDLEANVRYADYELRHQEKTWGKLLMSATTVYSACRWAISYLRPQGWSALNPQGGHGWKNRLANAVALDKRLP
jgi:hypothetical protein